jgi:hypothetical protein
LFNVARNLLNSTAVAAAVDGGEHLAVGHVQGGEQGADAIPDVIVGPPLGHTRHHRQHPGGTIEGLNWLFSSTTRTRAFSGGSR